MQRTKLPDERAAVTHAFRIKATRIVDGQQEPYELKGYLTLGLHEDGKPGELFVKLDQQGSTISGLMDAWAIAFSMCLQSGYSISDLCTKFRGMKFEPSGMTTTDGFNFVASPLDYICRWLLRREDRIEDALALAGSVYLSGDGL